MVHQDRQELFPSYNFLLTVTLVQRSAHHKAFSFLYTLHRSSLATHLYQLLCLSSTQIAEYDLVYNCECRKCNPCLREYLTLIVNQSTHRKYYLGPSSFENPDDDD